MFGDPLGGLFFGGETLDHFRLAIRPKNIDHPAKSGIFPRHEGWSLLGHPSNMRPRRPGSSQSSCHNRTDPLPRARRGEGRVNLDALATLCSKWSGFSCDRDTEPLHGSPVMIEQATELGNRQSRMKAARSNARAAFVHHISRFSLHFP
jgi:hypothetical protein